MRPVFHINPLTDLRWPDFLSRHPNASVFHTQEWLSALQATYGFAPSAYTTSSPGVALENGWVFCEVRSWLTGRRLVSLPFSDHCDPLTDNRTDLEDIAHTLEAQRKDHKWDYVQFRPPAPPGGEIGGFELRDPFYLHKLDLRPKLDLIFDKLSKDSIQRKILRAERDGLQYEEGRTESLVDSFYKLMCSTRRRHGLPPQPRKWFSNLFSALRNQAIIRLASKDGEPIGALFTIFYKNVLVYKYSCGEPKHFRHGGMQYLLWRAIEDAKARGIEELDFGRSDFEDQGLVLYKERWGAVRLQTGYFQSRLLHPARSHWFSTVRSKLNVPSFVPQRVLAATGRLLYRHFG
jgi:hypothetical protein